MATLKRGSATTLAMFFAALGLALGFLVYDGLASPRALKDADCATLEPQVQAFFDKTEKFTSADPGNWHQVRKLYQQLSKELKRLRLASDPMKERIRVLIETADQVEAAIYSATPSQRNRQAVAKAREDFRRALASIAEVCP